MDDRSNLKMLIDTIERTERDRRYRQAGIALLTGTVILGAVMLFFPHPKQAVVTKVPQAPAGPNAYAHLALAAKAAVVYDLATGQTLYEQNADAQLPLASITKLLTVYAAVNTFNTATPVTVSPQAVATEGDSGLHAGETFSFAELARFTLVGSSNDGAEAITEAVAAKRSMTGPNLLASAAQAAGLSETFALNGTGLDENTKTSGGYGSAHDIALLAGELVKQAPSIAEATVQPSITVHSLAGVTHTIANTNQFIVNIPGAELSKTGYTDLAGGNLVVVFDAGIGHPIAVVVLDSTENGRFTDVQQLASATLAHFAGLPAPGNAAQ